MRSMSVDFISLKMLTIFCGKYLLSVFPEKKKSELKKESINNFQLNFILVEKSFCFACLITHKINHYVR